MGDEKTYTIEKKDGKVFVKHQYSDYMNSFYRVIDARWKAPYRISSTKYYNVILNQLHYYYGMEDDKAVDLQIEVKKLKVKDKLIICGLPAITVNLLTKEFKLLNNTSLLDKYEYGSWEMTSSLNTQNNYFYTKIIMGFFAPFVLENCTITFTNISKTRAENFVKGKPKWAKKISIIESELDEFFEISKPRCCY